MPANGRWDLIRRLKVNIGTGKHEIKRIIIAFLAVGKPYKNMCFLKETGYNNFGDFVVG